MRWWRFVLLEVRRDDVAAELIRTMRAEEIVSHFDLLKSIDQANGNARAPSMILL